MGLALLLFLIAMALASGQEFDGKAIEKNISLNVYLLNTGQAMIMGYVDDPRGLIFLRPAQYTYPANAGYASRYRYENDTRQLYALTDSLTFKQGDIWKLVLTCPGFYGEYRVIFHLPGDLRLGRINSSEGLKYTVSASNDSLVVDAQAYSIRNPSIAVEYQQPLAKDISPEEINSVSSPNRLLIAGSIFFTLVIVSAFVFIARKRRKDVLIEESDTQKVNHLPVSEIPDKSRPIETANTEEAPRSKESQFVDISEEAELDVNPLVEEGPKKEIKINSEMAAVMETLTPRERSILEMLIRHGGRMTQTEMRYETGSPKSSLAMILISLEKRKLITKREWGRTNVVELSEWFLSRK